MDQCNPDTIVEGAEQPVLVVELVILADNYAKKYGAAALPFGHSNMQGLFPPVVDYSPSQLHRKQIRTEAEAACARPTPAWPPTLFADPSGSGKVIDTSVIVVDGVEHRRNPWPLARSAAECSSVPFAPPEPTPPATHTVVSDSVVAEGPASDSEIGEDAWYEVRARLQSARQLVEDLTQSNMSMALQGNMAASLQTLGARIVEDQHKHWFSDAYAVSVLSNEAPSLAQHVAHTRLSTPNGDLPAGTGRRSEQVTRPAEAEGVSGRSASNGLHTDHTPRPDAPPPPRKRERHPRAANGTSDTNPLAPACQSDAGTIPLGKKVAFAPGPHLSHLSGARHRSKER